MPSLSASSNTAAFSTTAKEIIKDALIVLGVYDPSEELEAEELAVDLRFLNRLMDALNSEAGMIYRKSSQTVATSSRTPTIGPGGTLDIVRPPKLEEGQVWLRSGTTDYFLRKMSQEDYAAVAGLTTTGIPEYFYYEPAFPLANLHFDVTPDASYTLVLYPWTLLNQITDASASLSLPPGEAEVLMTQLVLRLAPTHNKQSTPDMIENARIAKANFLRLNLETPEMEPSELITMPDGCVDPNAQSRGW